MYQWYDVILWSELLFGHCSVFINDYTHACTVVSLQHNIIGVSLSELHMIGIMRKSPVPMHMAEYVTALHRPSVHCTSALDMCNTTR